jgi:hypothetical protein
VPSNSINIPVCPVWSDKDWARASEREHESRLIPTAAAGGHFLPLDEPRAVIDQIEAFALRLQGKGSNAVQEWLQPGTVPL